MLCNGVSTLNPSGARRSPERVYRQLGIKGLSKGTAKMASLESSGVAADTPAAPVRPKRDAAATREKILRVGIKEFCAHGYSGARTARIAKRAQCNIRMLYHYFGSKEALYIAALERVYGEIRAEEERLDLLHLGPVEGVAALVEFTFDYMASHQDFAQLVIIENIQKGKFLRKSKQVPRVTLSLVESIEDLLKRGQKEGLFRKKVDPVQLYISILSLSLLHISNRHTLSVTYGQDLTDPEWLAERRRHARDMTLGYLLEKT